MAQSGPTPRTSRRVPAERVAGTLGVAHGFARGARLFGAAKALHEATGWVIWSRDRPDYQRCVAAARAALGEAAFAATSAEGRAMLWEAAVASALADEERVEKLRSADLHPGSCRIPPPGIIPPSVAR